MGFPTTSVVDTFTRAAPLGANWVSPAGSGSGTVTITSNQVSGGTANSDAVYTAAGAVLNAEVFFTVPVLPGSSNWVQAVLRASTSDNGLTNAYYCRVTPATSTWDLRKRVSGAASTSIVSVSTGFTAGDKIGFEIVGNRLAGYRYTLGAWTQVVNVVDNSITASGYIGLTISDDTQTVRLDDFGGGAATLTSDAPDIRRSSFRSSHLRR